MTRANTPGSCAAVASELRFFYHHVPDRQIPIIYYVKSKGNKLPTVLTHEEIRGLINAPNNLKHRLILMITYAAGLRAGEVPALKPEHILLRICYKESASKKLEQPSQRSLMP